MAVESPLVAISLISTADYRKSTLSGTTRLGPNGSGQYAAVRMSSLSTDRTFAICTASGQPVFGILQDAPNAGEAGAIAFFGQSKAICGTTTFQAGQKVMADTSGNMVLYSSGAGVVAAGMALELPSAVGAVFSMMVYGSGGPGTIA